MEASAEGERELQRMAPRRRQVGKRRVATGEEETLLSKAGEQRRSTVTSLGGRAPGV